MEFWENTPEKYPSSTSSDFGDGVNYNFMQEFLIEETPGKVMGLLGAALFSMAFLFAVSVSGAQLSGNVEVALPDPFASSKIVAAIDNLAASYANGLMAFTGPAREAFVAHTEAVEWVMAEASGPIVVALGLESLANPYAQDSAQVAGAFTSKPANNLKVSGGFGSFSVDHLFGLLVGE